MEGEHVPIRAVINNSGKADAKNYEVGLYLSQDSVTWANSQVMNTIKVSRINKDENEEIYLDWQPALYGDHDKNGKWYVGIWIYTNSTHKDSDLGNNKMAGKNYSLRVVPGEKNKPVIKITELTDQQEIEKSVRIIAKVTDESGIKSVNITIVSPDKTKYFREMTPQENDRYIIEFDNTSNMGEYNFTITAIDKSFYQKKSTINGVFEIIEDITPPNIKDVEWETYKEHGWWLCEFTCNATDPPNIWDEPCSGMDRVEFYLSSLSDTYFLGTVTGPGPVYECIVRYSPTKSIRGYILFKETTEEYVKFFAIIIMIFIEEGFYFCSYAYDNDFNGDSSMGDIFVTKLNETGGDLIFSTYVGTQWREYPWDILIDDNNNIYISGFNENNFPITPDAFEKARTCVILFKLSAIEIRILLS